MTPTPKQMLEELQMRVRENRDYINQLRKAGRRTDEEIRWREMRHRVFEEAVSDYARLLAADDNVPRTHQENR